MYPGTVRFCVSCGCLLQSGPVTALPLRGQLEWHAATVVSCCKYFDCVGCFKQQSLLNSIAP